MDRRGRHGLDDVKAVDDGRGSTPPQRRRMGWKGWESRYDRGWGVHRCIGRDSWAGHMDDDAGAVPSRCLTMWSVGRVGSTPGVGGTAAGLRGRIVAMRHGNRKRVALTRGPGRAGDPENNTNCVEEGKRTAMESVLVHRLGFLRYGRMT